MTDYPAKLGGFDGTGMIEAEMHDNGIYTMYGWFEAQNGDDASAIRLDRDEPLFEGLYIHHDSREYNAKVSRITLTRARREFGLHDPIVRFTCNEDPRPSTNVMTNGV